MEILRSVAAKAKMMSEERTTANVVSWLFPALYFAKHRKHTVTGRPCCS